MVEYARVEMVYLMKRKEKQISNSSLFVYNHILKLRKAKMNEKEKKEYDEMCIDLNYILDNYFEKFNDSLI